MQEVPNKIMKQQRCHRFAGYQPISSIFCTLSFFSSLTAGGPTTTTKDGSHHGFSIQDLLLAHALLRGILMAGLRYKQMHSWLSDRSWQRIGNKPSTTATLLTLHILGYNRFNIDCFICSAACSTSSSALV
jgi:hypothetical protein